MLLAVISPEIRCEWRLEDWQVALVSTVSSRLTSPGTPVLLLPSVSVLRGPVLCLDGVPGLHGLRSSGGIRC